MGLMRLDGMIFELFFVVSRNAKLRFTNAGVGALLS